MGWKNPIVTFFTSNYIKVQCEILLGNLDFTTDKKTNLCYSELDDILGQNSCGPSASWL